VSDIHWAYVSGFGTGGFLCSLVTAVIVALWLKK
jgi:hypothetical protein